MKPVLRTGLLLLFLAVWNVSAQVFPTGLAHRYSFTADAADSVGAAHGALQGGATISNGALALDGVSGFVDLPNNLVTGYTSITLEAWVIDNGSGNWARIWDFGNSTGGEGLPGSGMQYMFLSLPSGLGNLRGAYTVTGGGAGEQIVEWAGGRPAVGSPAHIAWTSDTASGVARLYINGVQVGVNSSMTLTPASLGPTVNNWLGKSQFAADAYFKGTINEFRIWSYALSAANIQRNYQNGPDSLADGPVSVVLQPQDQYVAEGQNVTLTAAVDGTPPIWLRWCRNGALLPGATNISFAFTATVAGDNASYQLWATNYNNGTNCFAASSNAVIHVAPDTNPPALLRAQGLSTNGVVLTFSERLRSDTVTNTANYRLTNSAGPVRVISAALDASGASVTLATDPLTLGSLYTVIVKGLRDLSGAGNLIAPNSQATFLVSPYVLVDIGAPVVGGVLLPAADGMTVQAGGTSIGGASDQFTFAYQMVAGDFDVQTRLQGLTAAEAWTKAGLMARETLDPSGRFAAVLATPGLQGSFFDYRATSGGTATATGWFPPNFPNTWLRLKRAGNQFTGFASFDSQTWTQLGSTSLALPNALYLGLAVASQDAIQTTTAQFQQIGATTSTAPGSMASPYEPPGPSSRRTPIAITEIMYKPARRSDGRNLEFLELYNSNPYFHDLSGWRIGGDVQFTFPTNTILPGNSLLIVAAAPGDVQAAYGLSGVFGPYTGSLQASGSVRLYDEAGALLLEVNYLASPPWPAAADGAGHSLVLARPSYGEGDPRAWDISDVVGGSPGSFEAYRPSPLRNVVINEILAHTDLPDVDSIELYNHSNTPLDLGGCILTDGPETNKFVIPTNTVIAARGFLAYTADQLGFHLSAAGETVYLKNPDQTRVLDAVRFGAQENGVPFGRFPDGSDQWYRLGGKTFGSANATPLVSQVGINEIMYHPLSGLDDDQYVELYNRGTTDVNLGGWKFVAGISFTFPANTILPADGYLVVARNAARLMTNYPNLNLANTVGNFGGRLSGAGERLALAMPHQLITTNSSGLRVTNYIDIVVDEVTYGTGGRWGQWSDGGGSSLELIDPRADKRLAANWADSDETAKAPWTMIETTGTLDNGANYEAGIAHAQVGLLDAGECLIDDVEVRPGTVGANYVANPGFEGGLASWSLQGCFSRSGIETNAGYGGSGNALHLRTAERLWTGANSAQCTLTNMTLASGQIATLRFKARWLKGWPEALLRLNGNWLEAWGRLPVPANLGTPGARNSRAVTNAGPAIIQVTHTPALPAAGQAVVVTARALDPDGVASLTLSYRVDPATNYTTVPMLDNGLGADAIAGDGIFCASIPGQAAGVVAAFTLRATDTRGAASRFPALLGDASPDRECVVVFGDPNPPSNFGAYHLWLTRGSVNRWTALPVLSNEEIDATFVSGNRVIYNMGARYAGSPYHQGFTSPSGSPCHHNWTMPKDDRFLGTSSFNEIHWIGNDIQDDSPTQNVNDATLQREQAANTFLRCLGVPWVNRRYVELYVNGSRRGFMMEDAARPSVTVPDEYFPGDTGGRLYKVQPWFEFGPLPNADGSMPWANESWGFFLPYRTTGGAYKTARYRWSYMPRQTPDLMSNYTNLFALIDAGGAYTNANYVAAMQNQADMENWIRVVAASHAAGNWDCWGIQNAQNLYAYASPQQRWRLFMFDLSIVLGNRICWSPGANLFTSADTYWAQIMANPTFRRMYLRALKELVNGAMTPAALNPLLDAKYAAFLADGLTAVQSPQSIKTWVVQARASIASQVAAQDAANFRLTAANVTATAGAGTLAGVAPVEVTSITVNGVSWTPAWTSTTNWTLRLPAGPGTNTLTVVAYDRQGNVVGGTNQVTIANSAVAEAPVGNIVINEIMFNPALDGAQFVELYNRAASTTFDLSGWRLNGLSYDFPPGSLLAPRGYLVLAKSRVQYAAAYGALAPVFAEFGGNLQLDGETLSLVQPGASPAQDLVVDRVRYETNSPWPAVISRPGASLQLVDSAHDNSRASNWALGLTKPTTPGLTNSVGATLPAYPTIWLNELQAENVTGPADNFGQCDPWVELYNPGSNAVSLSGFYLANTYTNPNQWPFPAGTTVNPGQFLLVWADGQPTQTAGTNLHTSFRIAPGSGSVLLSRLVNSTPQVVDYLNYAGLPANQSYGDVPDGQPFYRQTMSLSTPGATNNAALPPITVFINEWMAANTATLADPADGKFDDWFELYNPGTNTANLAGYFLTDDPTNKFKYAIPASYSISPGGFLLVWADKEPNQNSTNRPDLHADFKLDKAGEFLGLFAPDGRAIDAVTYGLQIADISEGHFPDGTGPRGFMPVPTPRAANIPPNTTPVLAPISDQFVYPGQVVHLTATATDSEAPFQALAFSLDAATAPGASINPTTGAFAWQATPGALPATNTFTIRVTDNGLPPLSATRTFAVIVLPPPQLTGVQIPGDGTVRFSYMAMPGYTYRVEFKNDLCDPFWTAFGLPVPGAGSVVIVADSTAGSQRFYHVVVSP